MASTRISELPQATSVTATDVIPIVNNDVTKKITLNLLSSSLTPSVGTFLPLSGGRINGNLTVTGNVSASSGLTVGNSTAPSDLYVSVDGNVGIGTELPSAKLTISGSVSARSSSFIFSALPTSPTGLPQGSLWVDTANGNVLKIV
jgi:hypothetical protein